MVGGRICQPETLPCCGVLKRGPGRTEQSALIGLVGVSPGRKKISDVLANSTTPVERFLPHAIKIRDLVEPLRPRWHAYLATGGIVTLNHKVNRSCRPLCPAACHGESGLCGLKAPRRLMRP